MRRAKMLALGVVSVVAVVAFAGCVGDTDPASPVRGTLAQLNAHGRTDNGPAYWWWEYETSQSVVANGLGRDTPHRGPASSSSDVPLSEVVRNLNPDTTYWFRACGQDQSSSTQVCGRILSFHTQVASTVFTSSDRFVSVFTAARGIRNDVTVTYSGGSTSQFDDPIQNGFGASIQPGALCGSVYTTGTRDDAARCSYADHRTEVDLGDLDDRVTINGSLPTLLDGESGSDVINGGPRNDYLIGGYNDVNHDYLRGNDGDDVIHAEGGSRGDGDDIDCGAGNDTVYTDFGSVADNAGAKNCETFISVPSGSATAH